MPKRTKAAKVTHATHPGDTSRKNRETAIGGMIKPQPDGCWLFTGQRTTAGYGVVWAYGESELAHRFVYRTLIDEIPDGLILHHTCETPACVNPDHLAALTKSEHSTEHARLRAAVKAAA